MSSIIIIDSLLASFESLTFGRITFNEDENVGN